MLNVLGGVSEQSVIVHLTSRFGIPRLSLSNSLHSQLASAIWASKNDVVMILKRMLDISVQRLVLFIRHCSAWCICNRSVRVLARWTPPSCPR
jgi:hypothetical protein